MRLLLLLPLAATLFAQESGVRLIGGKPIRYEIIDGQAVVGDIILGPAAETPGKDPLRAASTIASDDLLWPGAVVPYEIDSTVPALFVAEIERERQPRSARL